jgi:alpha-D-ribose 1-methylphosphonate 5-triphosphate synthase subunit PhnH
MMIENMEHAKLSPGFANYAAASQEVFRLALDCMSRPCRAVEFPDDLAPVRAPLPAVPAALALSLLDALTPVWLSPSWRKAENWLRFHCGCPVCEFPEQATLVLAASLDELPPFSALNQGSLRYPDSSSTVILYSGLTPGGPNQLRVTGPGIKDFIIFQGHGLNESFLKEWQINRKSYPLGVDVFLAGVKHLAGLPRSVKLEKGDGLCM